MRTLKYRAYWEGMGWKEEGGMEMGRAESRPHQTLELGKSPDDDRQVVLMRRPGTIIRNNNNNVVNSVDGSRSSRCCCCCNCCCGCSPRSCSSMSEPNLLFLHSFFHPPRLLPISLPQENPHHPHPFSPPLFSSPSTTSQSILPSSSSLHTMSPSPTNDAFLRCPPSASAPIISSGLYVKIRSADMPIRMQLHAIQLTKEILDNCKQQQQQGCRIRSLMEAARALKQSFDDHHGYVWHCIVGSSFGSYVTHTVGTSIYFSVGKLAVLLFKTSLPPPCPSSG